MPQSQISDQPMAPRGRNTEHRLPHDSQNTLISKDISPIDNLTRKNIKKCITEQGHFTKQQERERERMRECERERAPLQDLLVTSLTLYQLKYIASLCSLN